MCCGGTLWWQSESLCKGFRKLREKEDPRKRAELLRQIEKMEVTEVRRGWGRMGMGMEKDSGVGREVGREVERWGGRLGGREGGSGGDGEKVSVSFFYGRGYEDRRSKYNQ